MSFSSSLISRFVDDLSKPSNYIDRKYEGGVDQFVHDLARSTTLYIGNLSFYTTEEQLHAFFSKVGPIRRIIMGLDRNRKTPCGFCFVEYEGRVGALHCKRLLDGMRLDDRFIRVDLDPGFKEGRQFGRGRTGGQVRDEFREDYDAARGGWGGASQEKLDQFRESKQRATYEPVIRVPHGRSH